METSDDDSSSLEISFSEDDSKTENNAQNINRRNDNLTDVSDYEDVTKNNISPRTNKQVKNSVVMSPSSSNDKKFNEQNKQHINRTSPRRCNLQKVIKYGAIILLVWPFLANFAQKFNVPAVSRALFRCP